MEWVLKLEASSGWGDVETIEVGRLERRITGLMAEELGLTLAESKALLGELARLVFQTQVEEFITSDRVCGSCRGLRRLRDRRTRKIQTLFGTVTVDAPRISACPCGSQGFVDVSWSSLTDLLPDRCTPELRRLQAELSARHSYREAARLRMAKKLRMQWSPRGAHCVATVRAAGKAGRCAMGKGNARDE